MLMMAGELEAGMRALAQSQHGVLSRAQARSLATNREALRRRVRSPGWLQPTPLVLQLAGSPRSFSQACMVAVLDSGRGAVACKTTAAALWGLPGFGPGRVHVVRPRGRNGRATSLATVHESRYLPEHHRAVVGGVPVTTVARTIFDLAGSVHPERTARALDNGLTRNLVGLDAVRAVTIELLSRGRAGSGLMRELLAGRGAGYIPPASGLEAQFLALLVAARIELPECQVDLGGEAWVGRVDFYYPRLRLVIEIDSELHHTSKLDTENDARRDAALRSAGFLVLRFTEAQLRHRPEEVVTAVRAALRTAG